MKHVEPLATPEDLLCEKHYKTNTKRNPDGRYIVRLPF